MFRNVVVRRVVIVGIVGGFIRIVGWSVVICGVFFVRNK